MPGVIDMHSLSSFDRLVKSQKRTAAVNVESESPAVGKVLYTTLLDRSFIPENARRGLDG
jgi:hypothetical protein